MSEWWKDMISHSRLFVLISAGALLCGCSKEPEGATMPNVKMEHAPEVYKVKFETSKGDFILQVNKSWAPLGADRFFSLLQSGFYNNARFFRVISGFMAQFGLAADPKVTA